MGGFQRVNNSNPHSNLKPSDCDRGTKDQQKASLSVHFKVKGFSNYANLLSVFLILSGFFLEFSIALDILHSPHSIRDHETISSADDSFQLGFFSPENSTNRYVGIWYLSPSYVVWVANKDNPLRDSSGIVRISENGNLVVLNGRKQLVWSSNVSNAAILNSTAQLLNSGNLVLLDETTGETVWESFQHPSHTFMPKMIVSTNGKTGKKVEITSWKSPSDTSDGDFSFSLERLRVPELFIWNQRQPYWRSGPWNGRVFIGYPKMENLYPYGVNIGRDGDGTVHLTVTFPNESFFAMLVLDSQGTMMQTSWNNKKEIAKFSVQDSECDIYGFCGTFGSCNSHDSPICSCLRGFKPRNIEEWNRRNWTSGCVRSAALQCENVINGSEASKGDGFLKLQNMKVPDFVVQSTVSEDSCRNQCLENCSCMAYSYDGGIGCMSWGGNLLDIQRFSTGGADLYIRVPNSELDQRERRVKTIIIIMVIVGATIIGACAYFSWTWTCKHSGNAYIRIQSDIRLENLKQGRLQLFDFRKIATATSNFDEANKLGRGGFGPVYKGKFQDGQEIAVKRLSQASGQGIEEFLNEVEVISKLQHRNLVRLLGCCIEANEKMLVYEYMPNNCLDAYLFDTHRIKSLDWKKRFNIIEGIARGLLYLHRDSRLRIIHRDLKGSNILLDEELNPKISDFGTARIFQGSEDEANTIRIVGTYGYMSPEYAIKGLFSEKSDVFSFGVLILEIVSGRRNTSFYDDLESLTLLGYAWNLWNEGNIKSLADPQLSDPCFESDILRSIHISLLCVQELARDRPSMATVISMLNSDVANLPSPNQPAFCRRQTIPCATISNEKIGELQSINGVIITDVHGR